MQIKNVVLASLIMGASLFASSAYAENVEKTVTINLEADGEGGFNTHVGNNFGGAAVNNTFTDKYLFVLGSNYDSSSSITSSYLSSSTIKDLQITGFSLVKYNPTTDDILYTYTGINHTGSAANSLDQWELTAMGLSSGSYYLKVDGLVVGSGGGSYGSDLTIAVAAVPEPETYGMMVAGLGLLGFMARRKQAKKANAA